MFNRESILIKQEKEPGIETRVYSVDNIPDKKAAENISAIFLNNYPSMYSEELRTSDSDRYDSPEKIRQQVEDGNFFITAKVDNKIVGMTKFRKEKRTDTSDCEEWLGSWIMVDEPYRKLGIAEKLFGQILEILNKMKIISGKKVFFVADVHKDNASSISLCKKMGCGESMGKSQEYLLFRREIIG